MPKPILDRPRIVAFAGQGVATGMSEHVDVNLERQAGTLTDAFDKPIDGIRRKWGHRARSRTRNRYPGIADAAPGML